MILIGGDSASTHLLLLCVRHVNLNGLLGGFRGELLKELDTADKETMFPSSAHSAE